MGKFSAIIFVAASLLVVSSCQRSPSVANESKKNQEALAAAALQTQIAKMHFDNGDYVLARKEYVRILLNKPSEPDREGALYYIAESYYFEGDCLQAERHYSHYVSAFASGRHRQECEVRLAQCADKREAAEMAWETGKLRSLRETTMTNEIPATPGKKFRTTWYWIEDEASYERKELTPLLGIENNVLAHVPAAFLKRLNVEGTGRLRSGSIVTWVAKERYQLAPKGAPHGLGAQGRALIPLRTVAVDPRVVALDTIIYIAELDGANLMNGERHDGCFIAGDVGSGIQGAHVDLFAATYDQALWLMRSLPEALVLRQPASHCRSSYSLNDGYRLAIQE